MKAGSFGLALALAPAVVAAPVGEIGQNDFRISFQGGTGDTDFGAGRPAVAYNSAANEYLVVYEGDRRIPFPTCPMGSPIEREIFRQRIDAETGMLLGSGASISQSGPTCDDTHAAASPAVAYNATNDEYLVVWSGDDDSGGLVDDEFEIFGQRLNNLGNPIGGNFRISFRGGTGNAAFDAFLPDVTWNATAKEYLVVWHGDDSTGGVLEYEIFGQRLNENGTAQGAGNFRISDMGDSGDPSFAALAPKVAWNATANQYLVVWRGDDDTGGLVENEVEIFGQRLGALGAEIGANDFRISEMTGPILGTGSGLSSAIFPDVSWNAATNEYLVVWEGIDDDVGFRDPEIFGQRLDSLGRQVGTNDFRISDMGGDGQNFMFVARNPAVTRNATANEYLVVWHGSDDIGGQVGDEQEIFVQRLDAAGGEIGPNDFRISDMGGLGSTTYSASMPAVAWNSATDEFLVVWEGDDNVGGLVNNEFEIFGQRLGDPTIFADGFE